MSNIVTFPSDDDHSDFNLANEATVDADGKTSLTITGMAMMVGVNKATLSRHFDPVGLSSSKLAQSLINRGFQPLSFSKTRIPDTAIPIIVEYYAFDAGARCTEQAKATAKIFMGVGVRAYFQNIKGWKPPQSTFKDEIIQYLPSKAAKWEKRFHDAFWYNLHEVYGLKRGDLGCASFIRAYIYGWFPQEVQERLDEINPLVKGEEGIIAVRKNRNHQYFREELLDLLIYHIQRVTDLLETSRNQADFRERMKMLPKYNFGKRLGAG